MPELPDVTVYAERLEALLRGQRLEKVRLGSPFVLRSVRPPLSDFAGRALEDVSRLGKRIVLEFEDDLFLVIHLMISGRLWWRRPGIAIPRKRGLAAFDFPHGTVLFTEESTRKRASLAAVQGRSALAALDPGGMEVLGSSLATFEARLRQDNHTLKRALTDPRCFSGIGNSYSDEILHRARLSPFKQTEALSAEEVARLHEAVQAVLREWTEKLREEVGSGFPEKVTAFRTGMAVHGRFGQPCPDCGSPVQRIVYAENEANYCAKCQTAGKLLADRALSRLLKKNWPRTLEELEDLKSNLASRS